MNENISKIIANISLYEKIKFRILDFIYHLFYIVILNRISTSTRIKISCNFMKLYGYNVIAYSHNFCEHVYFFETDIEATIAAERFERNDNILSGWWYGLDSQYFDDTLNCLNERKISITVLDKKFENRFNNEKSNN